MNSHSKRQAGRTGPWLQALMALILGAMLLAAGPARNPLKGALGDALHVVICGAGHSLRLILAALRLCCARFGLSMRAVIAALLALPFQHQLAHD